MMGRHERAQHDFAQRRSRSEAHMPLAFEYGLRMLQHAHPTVHRPLTLSQRRELLMHSRRYAEEMLRSKTVNYVNSGASDWKL